MSLGSPMRRLAVIGCTLCFEAGLFIKCSRQRRADHAGADGIAANAARSPFGCELLGQLQDARFAGAVSAAARLRVMAEMEATLNDATATVRRSMSRPKARAADEITSQVDGKNRIPVGNRNGFEWARAQYAGVVDEDVATARDRMRPLSAAAATAAFISDVAGDGYGGRAAFGQCSRDRRSRVAIPINHRDLGASFREPARNCGADPAARAGDDADASCKPSQSLSLLSVVHCSSGFGRGRHSQRLRRRNDFKLLKLLRSCPPPPR